MTSMDAEFPARKPDALLQQYQALLRIAEALASQQTLPDLLRELRVQLREVVPYNGVIVLLYDEARDLMREYLLESELGLTNGLPRELPAEGTPGGWVCHTQEPFFVSDTLQEPRFREMNLMVAETGVRSYCVLPLTSAGRKLGAIGFASGQLSAYDPKDRDFFLLVARQVAVAVDNALHLDAARQSQAHLARERDRLQLLLDINNAVVATLDLRALLQVISPCLRRVVGHDFAALLLYDAERDQLRAHALDFPEGTVSEGVLFSMDGTPSGLAFRTRQTVLVDRAMLERFGTTPLIKLLRAEGVKSGCSLPLLSHDRALGVLTLMSLREENFSQQDAQFLTQIAGQIAIAVENSLNFESARQAEQRMAHERDHIKLLLEINNAVVSHLDLRELVKTVSASLREVMPHDAAGIALYEPEAEHLREYVNISYQEAEVFREGDIYPLIGTPAGEVFTTGEPLLLRRPDPAKYPADRLQTSADTIARSACLVLLSAHGRKLGILGVANTQEDNFSAEDLELLRQVAFQVAIAVENSLNFERARAAEKELARKLDHLRLMLNVTTTIVAQLDLRELLLLISSSIREVMEADTVGVALYDHESGELRAFATDVPPGHPFREDGYPIPMDASPGGLAFRSGQPVFLEKPDLERFNSAFGQQLYESGYRSGGSIPLIVQGRKLGVMGVASKRESAFSAEDKELLCQIANQVAIAVANALSYERTRAAEEDAKQQSDRLQLLLQVNNAIASALDLQSLFRAVSACLRLVFRHDYAVMGLYDDQQDILRVHLLDRGEGIDILQEGQIASLENTPVGLAIRTKQAVVTGTDYLKQFPSEVVQRAVSQGIRANCSVPLLRKNRVIGAMSIASKTECAFSTADGELFLQIAGQVAIAVENALAFQEIEGLKNKLASEKLYLEDEIRTQHNFEELIGESQTFRRILKQVETVAPTDSTVLICGETGTGKELIARAIHDLSGRRERTLVKINCAAIPTGLLESELFGHEKGAFTGAISQRIGRFELAHRGTLFLDEVGDIPQELQPKLLRVLQENEFERLGSTRTQKVDVRLIAATNADLENLVADKKFRSDLFYRLNVFPITIPPLRERREDIPALARFFTQKYARRLKKQITAIPARVMEALTSYHWPGNVRELEHFIERAVILTSGAELEVSLAELKSAEPAVVSELATLEVAEREHILRALEESNWVVGGPQGAAARLGMKRTTLQSKMQKLGISRTS